MDEVVERLTYEKWSPELIYAQARLCGMPMISHESIYQWIWQCKHRNIKKDRRYKKLYQLLRHGRRRRKRGNRRITGDLYQTEYLLTRDQRVEKRNRPGDIEIDLIMGKAHKSAVLIMTDRATLHTRMTKLHSKKSKKVEDAIIKCMKKNKHKVHTFTFDNDQAFAEHERVARKIKAFKLFYQTIYLPR